jgi:hypothetical protein
MKTLSPGTWSQGWVPTCHVPRNAEEGGRGCGLLHATEHQFAAMFLCFLAAGWKQ